MKRLLLPLAILVSLGPVSAQAPAGFFTWKDKETGLQAYLPKTYRQIPLPPTETTLRSKSIAKESPSELRRQKARPQIYVFMFKKQGGGTTQSPSGTSKAEAEGKPEQPGNLRELMEQRGAVTSFDDLKKKKLGRLEAEEVPGKVGHYSLHQKRLPSKSKTGMKGYLVKKEQGGSVFGVYGITWHPHTSKMQRLVQRIASKLKLPEGNKALEAAGAVDRELDRIYRGKSYRHLDTRKTVRKNLARGWKARDTENYIIVSHTRNTKLLNRIAKNIEAMRVQYISLFKPARDVTAVSVVRVCRNQGEYLQYGGRRGTGGYWHPGNEELVFYDYLQETLDAATAGRKTRRRTTNRDSLLVLYHEAFHQYIHYAVGEIAPHDWFNEGHGDFFSGAVITSSGSKVTKVRPSWWRIHRAKDQMEFGKGKKSLEKLLKAPRQVYYNPREVADWYAAGWSFVYFMRMAKDDPKFPKKLWDPAWDKLLDHYFEALKASYQEAVGRLGGDDAELSSKRSAQAEARKHAIEFMLKGVDIPALEAAWVRYVKSIRDPWPHLRKKQKR